jgi:hypothetical protein
MRQNLRFKGINAVGLGSCRFTQPIRDLRVHGIDRDASLQQEGNEQAMVRFDNTGQLIGRSRDAQQKLFQLVQAFVAVRKAPRANSSPSFIQHHDIMMGVSPVQSNVPHLRLSFSSAPPGGSGPSITGAQSNDPPIID